MKLILAYLIMISLYAQAAGPDCVELGKIMTGLETDLLKSHLKQNEDENECDEFKKDFELKSETIDKYCTMDLIAIETQLRTLDNEMMLINGIKSLKEQINLDLEKFKPGIPPNPKGAAKDLKENVSLASSLEALLEPEDQEGERFLIALSEDETRYENLGRFNQFRNSYCDKKKAETLPLCDLELNDKTFPEVQAFVVAAKGKKKNISNDTITDLRNTLSIKKANGEDYSYTELSQELQKTINDEGDLTRAGVATIKSLPEIKNSKDHSFLKKIQESKSTLQANVLIPQFKFLLEDLEKRQKWQMDSKLSLIKKQIDTPVSCNGSALNCLEMIKTDLTVKRDAGEANSGKISQVSNMIDEFKIAEDHLKTLSNVKEKCMPKGETLNYDAACFDAVTNKEAEISLKTKDLNLLKDRILEKNESLETLRNYAIEKYQSQKCAAEEDLKNSECFGELEKSISMESLALSVDTLKIFIVQDQMSTDTDISELCEDKEIKDTKLVQRLSRLCKYDSEKVSDTISLADANSIRAPTTPDIGHDPVRGAMMASIGRLLNEGLNSYMYRPNPFPPTFPMASYPTTYTQDAARYAVPLGYGLYPQTPPLTTNGLSSEYFKAFGHY